MQIGKGIKRGLNAVIVSIYVFILLGVPSQSAWAEGDGELKERIKKSVDQGLHWLRNNQQENGSWRDNAGITSLVVMAYMKSPRKYNEGDDPFVRKGIEFIMKNVRPDGSIYKEHPPSYNTALAILALESTRNPRYKETIKKAQDFLIGHQSDEEEGYMPSDKYYGGIGYGGDERPDLSNLQFAVEALRVSGVSIDNDVWEKAVKFISRSQNRSESNDQPWAKDDGGFIYSPKETFVPDYVSYGSMTFAGIKSLIFSNVSKKDPRIQSAIEWVKKHYTVDENPNFDHQALYYYYYTFAKALSIYGEKGITTADGVKHDWYRDLAEKLMSLQSKEGYWVNTVNKFWEGNKDLVTAYAILAMETEYDSLKE